MKISFNQKVAAFSSVTIIAMLFVALTGRSNHSLPSLHASQDTQTLAASDSAGEKETNAAPSVQRAVAPFIVRDTDNDSPGTNIVTRIVTFSAEVGGAPPPVLQWKVDKGNGFVDVAGATRASFRIGNAQVSDSGFYSLFATNSAGGTHTTPQQLSVTEGED
jgi:hypothetical protein